MKLGSERVTELAARLTPGQRTKLGKVAGEGFELNDENGEPIQLPKDDGELDEFLDGLIERWHATR